LATKKDGKEFRFRGGEKKKGMGGAAAGGYLLPFNLALASSKKGKKGLETDAADREENKSSSVPNSSRIRGRTAVRRPGRSAILALGREEKNWKPRTSWSFWKKEERIISYLPWGGRGKERRELEVQPNKGGGSYFEFLNISDRGEKKKKKEDLGTCE